MRAFSLLEALVSAERPPALTDLTLAVGLPKPTVYRMLAMLEDSGFAAREPGARRYIPGPRLARFAQEVMLNSSVRGARRAILARAVGEIGETCNFTMLDGAEVMYVDRVEAAWPLRMYLTAGSRVPLHCTASGKLLLALLPKARREHLAAQLALTRYTDTTITDRKKLTVELARIRATRYAIDNQECHAGLVCVAVPVVNGKKRVCAALAVQAPVSRMPLERALAYLPVLRHAAEVIASTLP